MHEQDLKRNRASKETVPEVKRTLTHRQFRFQYNVTEAWNFLTILKLVITVQSLLNYSSVHPAILFFSETIQLLRMNIPCQESFFLSRTFTTIVLTLSRGVNTLLQNWYTQAAERCILPFICVKTLCNCCCKLWIMQWQIMYNIEKWSGKAKGRVPGVYVYPPEKIKTLTNCTFNITPHTSLFHFSCQFWYINLDTILRRYFFYALNGRHSPTMGEPSTWHKQKSWIHPCSGILLTEM